MLRTYSYILPKQITICRPIQPNDLPLIYVNLKIFDQVSLDADGDDTYRLTPYPIKARNPVKSFTPDEVENRFTHADFTAQQLGIYSQHDWTESIDKMKFNHLVDNAAEKFEVARAVNVADLAKQAQLQAQFSQLRTEYND